MITDFTENQNHVENEDGENIVFVVEHPKKKLTQDVFISSYSIATVSKKNEE
jgi:hypothetical protein